MDGASTVYGSDAGGGVVNFVTRRDYNGFDVNARYGTVTEGSKEEFSIGAAGGANWGTGGLFVGIQYLDAKPLRSSERDFIDVDVANPDGSLGAKSEKLSAAASVNQTIRDGLSLHIDALLTNRESESDQQQFGQLTRRGEQEAIYVNTRIDYQLSSDLTAQLFFDHSSENFERSDSRDDFGSTTKLVYENELSVLEGRLSGSLLELPAGAASFAIGGLLRDEGFNQIDNFDRVDGGERTLSPERDVVALYGEALLPIIDDEMLFPLAQRIDLSLAGRYEDYSDFGSTFNPKFGVYWGVNDDFAMRGSYSESFRAPIMSNLAVPREYFIFAFPTSFLTSVEAPPQDPRLSAGTTSFLFSSGGNPSLTEESATAWNAGFEYAPSFVSGLSVTVNYFNVEYEDRIESVNLLDPVQVPEFSSLAQIPPDIALVNAIFLDSERPGGVPLTNVTPITDISPEDIQVLIENGFQNLSQRNVEGLDLNVSYVRETDVGTFDASLNASYVFEYQARVTEQTGLAEQVDLLYRPIDMRLRGSLSWFIQGFTVFSAINYQDSYQDNINDAIANKIDSWTTFDLTLSYDSEDRFGNKLLNNTVLSLSIRNLFDENPPSVATPLDGLNYDPTNADPFGRFVSVALSKRF